MMMKPATSRNEGRTQRAGSDVLHNAEPAHASTPLMQVVSAPLRRSAPGRDEALSVRLHRARVRSYTAEGSSLPQRCR